MNFTFQVVAPILKNEKNLSKYPQCVADDIKRQVHELSTSVYQIRGHIKGKTLLPFPQVRFWHSWYCIWLLWLFDFISFLFYLYSILLAINFQQGAARIAEEERRVRESKGEECDMTLKNNIEGIIIKWAYQTDEVSIKKLYPLNCATHKSQKCKRCM